MEHLQTAPCTVVVRFPVGCCAVRRGAGCGSPERHHAVKCALPCCAAPTPRHFFLPSSRSSVWQFGCTRGDRSIRRNYRLAVFPWQQDTVSVGRNQTQALGLILKKGPPPLLLPCHPLLFAPPWSFLLPLSTRLISLLLTEPVHREEQFGSVHAGTQHSAACTNTLKPNLPGKLL